MVIPASGCRRETRAGQAPTRRGSPGVEPCRRHLPRHKTGPDVPNKGSATANPCIPATHMTPRAQDVLTINQSNKLCRKCFALEYNGKGCVEQFKICGSWCLGCARRDLASAGCTGASGTSGTSGRRTSGGTSGTSTSCRRTRTDWATRRPWPSPQDTHVMKCPRRERRFVPSILCTAHCWEGMLYWVEAAGAAMA